MGPDIGAGFEALIFFSLTIAQILLCLVVFSYAGHSFYTVFADSAAGNAEIRWPDDPYQDWLFKFWYLLWLLLVWAVPACLLLGLLPLPRPVFVLCLIGLLWLAFPVTMLSSSSAASSAIILRGLIVQLMLKNIGTTVRFYASTGLLLAVCGGLCYVGTLTSYSVVLPVAAVAGAVGFLIYARLLGRLAWVTSLRKGSKKKRIDADKPEEADRLVTFDPWSTPEPKTTPATEPAASKPPPELPVKKRKVKRKAKSKACDPWAPPEEEPPAERAKQSAVPVGDPDDPYGPAQGSYEMMPENSPLSAIPITDAIDPELKPYEMAAPVDLTLAPPPAPPAVSKLEEELAAPRKPPKLPKQPLLDGVYGFPFYQASLAPLFALTLGLLGIGFLLRLQIAAFPSAWK